MKDTGKSEAAAAADLGVAGSPISAWLRDGKMPKNIGLAVECLQKRRGLEEAVRGTRIILVSGPGKHVDLVEQVARSHDLKCVEIEAG